MSDDRRTNSMRRDSASQPTSDRRDRAELQLGGTRKARRPDPGRLLTLSEAAETFGIDYKAIYRLAELGLVDPLQRDGKGRIYYSERQIRQGLTKCYPALVAA